MFGLPQSPQDLSYARVQDANPSYQQYFPTSSATYNSFSQGTIVIPFSLSQPNWWMPSKSYVRMLVNTSFPLAVQANPDVATMGVGSPFLQSQGVAPAMFQAASLFSRIEVLVNGVTVDLISDWTPQITAFLERTLRPKALTDSTMYSRDFTDADFRERQSRVTVPSLNALGLDDQTTTTASIYDYGVPRVTAAQGCVATVPAAQAGTNIVITLNATTSADSFASVIARWRPGDIVTILNDACGTVAVQAQYVSAVGTSNTVLTITVTNISGFGGANLTFGSNAGKPAQVFVSRVQPRQIANTYELCWKPPTALFQLEHAIPGGAYVELRLTPWPASVFQARAVETIAPNLVAGQQFQVQIQDLSLQLYTMAGPRVENLNWLADLSLVVGCQAQSITVGANSLLSQNWDVPSSTYYIGIAIQNRDLNNSAVSSTKFVAGSLVAGNQGLQNTITRLFIQFRGNSQPAQKQEAQYVPYGRSIDTDKNPPPGDAAAPVGNDQFVMRWLETQLNCGLAFSGGGSEREIDWLDRGAMFTFSTPSDVSAQSTRLQTNIQFSQDLSQIANVLCFTISRKVASIAMEAGRYTSVVVQDL